MKKLLYIGLDVHTESITIAVADEGRQAARRCGMLRGRPHWIRFLSTVARRVFPGTLNCLQFCARFNCNRRRTFVCRIVSVNPRDTPAECKVHVLGGYGPAFRRWAAFSTSVPAASILNSLGGVGSSAGYSIWRGSGVVESVSLCRFGER